jgi:arabinofuranosyltransferase
MDMNSTIEPAGSRPRAFPAVVVLLAVLFVPWSMIAYNHTGEDLFITLRYAKHFIEGHGLVFNPQFPAEHVEGYSNLLWLLLIALFGWLGANMDITARMLAILAGSGLILLMPFYRRTGGDRLPRRWIEIFAPAAILTQPILHYVNDGGLETTFHALLLFSAGILLVRQCYWGASLLLGAAAMTRPEGFAYWFCFGLVVACDMARPWMVQKDASAPARKPLAASLRIALEYLLPWLIIVGALLAWRLDYYGAKFPNTVHAKIPHWAGDYVRFGRLRDFTIAWSGIPVVALAGLVCLWRTPVLRAHRREIAVALVAIVAICSYATLVGSVAERFRHLAPPIPFVIALLQLCLLAMASSAAAGVRIAATAAAVVLLVANFYQPTNFDPSPRTRFHVRTAEFLAKPDWTERVVWFLHDPVHPNADAGKWIDRNLPPEAIVGADQVGLLGYYSNRTVVDLLALCDGFLWKHFHQTDVIRDYLLRRNVSHLAILVRLEDDKKPLEFEPPIPHLAKLVKDARFLSEYRLRAMLLARPYPTPLAFALYERRSEPPSTADKPPDILRLGLSPEKFEALWRYDKAR